MFKDIFPDHIDGLYSVSEHRTLHPILLPEDIQKINQLPQNNTAVTNNLYEGDCLDFTYTMRPGPWVQNSHGTLQKPHKGQCVPYQKATDGYGLPILYYHDGERSHACFSLGKGLCIGRMGVGGDLMITRIQDLQNVYGDEVMTYLGD